MIQDISLGLLETYKGKINTYDEVLDQNSQVKPYWQGLFDTLESIGIDELQLRNDEIVKKLKENGVTYNVYDSNKESNRAWKLDPIPFLIHESEWKTIEKGLQQRARLLDLILKDLSLITTEAQITLEREPLPMSKVTGKVIDDLEEQMKRGNKLMGLTTGWQMLDKYIGGWNKGNLIIIAGRPGSGKTAIALSLTIGASQLSKVLFMSLEMSSEELAKRYISYFANIENFKIRSGNLKVNEHQHIANSLYQLTTDFYVDDDAKSSINDIRAKAQLHKAKHGLNIIIIDYLQLVKGTKANREQEIAEISRNLKIMAKELGITVICLAQLNRNSEQRADKRPMLSDLRESGSIEQDADVVMFPFRPQYYMQEQTDIESDAELIIAKNRHGSTVTIPVVFEGKYTKYTERI